MRLKWRGKKKEEKTWIFDPPQERIYFIKGIWTTRNIKIGKAEMFE